MILPNEPTSLRRAMTLVDECIDFIELPGGAICHVLAVRGYEITLTKHRRPLGATASHTSGALVEPTLGTP